MQIDDNIEVYEFAFARTKKAFNSLNYLEASAWASIAGQCAWHSHAGFYVHRQSEEILLQIGRSLDHKAIKYEEESVDNTNNLRILHVFSVATPIGGHTRLVERWITNRLNNSECHSVLLLDQGFIRVPEWLKIAANKSGGSFISLPDDVNIIERALMLREISYESADVIVLHISPNDPIPLIAFAVDGGPPVVILNHADHVFWYGSFIADLVADIRPVGQQLSLQRRGVDNSLLLPIPLLQKKLLNKSLCRNELHLPDDKIILLSIANSYKFNPYNDLDFPKVVSTFIKSNPNTILIVIGPLPNEINWQNAIEATNGRILVSGIVENIDIYYGAADIYLESFPFGSLTSSLDAVLHGLPVIQAPTPVLPLLHMDQYNGMQGNAPDIVSYYNYILQCVDNNEFRHQLGKTQKQSIEEMHTGDGWQKYVDTIMDKLLLKHKVKPIIIDNSTTDKSDVIWADLQSMSTSCNKSALLELIIALRANSKYLKHGKLFMILVHVLLRFGITYNKVFLSQLMKTLAVIVLPTYFYKILLRARTEKNWGKDFSKIAS